MLIDRVWLSPAMFDDVARLTGTHIRTVRRWYRAGRLPTPVAVLLELVEHGNLGKLHDAWRGWSIDTRRGVLVTPVGDCVTPGQIAALPYRLHQIAALERERRLRADSDAQESRRSVRALSR